MAELPASTYAVKGTPMASNKTPAAVITDTFKVVRVIQPVEGPYGPGIKVELLGEKTPAEAYTWWNQDEDAVTVGESYKMGYTVAINGGYTNRTIKWANLIKPADNKPDPDSEADPDPDPDPDIETGNTGPGFDIIFSGPDGETDHKPPMTPPNPMALGACQNNFVELVAAGFIDIPEWANESKETMAAFVHQGRDVFYRGVNQQPVEMPQFCYYHRKQRIKGTSGEYGHSMEEAEFAPAPDWETEDGEGKRYCMKSQ